MEGIDEKALYIFRLILYNPIKVAILVVTLVFFLRHVLRISDFAFGMIYKWLTLTLHSPASKFGAGIGGTIGLAFGISNYYGSWSAGATGFCVGALLGGFTCNGIYQMRYGDHNQQAIERPMIIRLALR